MANLKQDIQNNLGNDKYYAELELARLAQDPNMVYREKVEMMSDLLKELAALDLGIQLIGKYFQDEQQQNQQVTQEQPTPQQPQQPQTHPGQTHGE
jgi:hypothetical protein